MSFSAMFSNGLNRFAIGLSSSDISFMFLCLFCLLRLLVGLLLCRLLGRLLLR